MSECGVSHSHYSNAKSTELNKRFLQNGTHISQDMLCEKAESILNKCKRNLSNDDLFLCIALSNENTQYSIIELTIEYYNEIRNIIHPFALLISSYDNNALIENAPCGTKEIFALSSDENFDYVSNQNHTNGARITLVTPNKISIANCDLFGTSFYHYDYIYRILDLDLNNIPFAHLAIEIATILLDAPRASIYHGLKKGSSIRT